MIRSDAVQIEFQASGSYRSIDERLAGATALESRARRCSAMEIPRNHRLRAVPKRSKCSRGFRARPRRPSCFPACCSVPNSWTEVGYGWLNSRRMVEKVQIATPRNVLPLSLFTPALDADRRRSTSMGALAATTLEFPRVRPASPCPSGPGN
jgi:hypothetical protein